MSDSNCCSEPVSYAAAEEDGTSGLVMEIFDDLDKIGDDVALLYGCPQSCMPNHVECILDILQQDLADRRMAHSVDSVPGHDTSQERQRAAVPELPNDQPHQPSKQSHANDHTEQIEATSGEDHRRRTRRLQSRKQHHKADQPGNPL